MKGHIDLLLGKISVQKSSIDLRFMNNSQMRLSFIWWWQINICFHYYNPPFSTKTKPIMFIRQARYSVMSLIS
jgi:hypothetical protein